MLERDGRTSIEVVFPRTSRRVVPVMVVHGYRGTKDNHRSLVDLLPASGFAAVVYESANAEELDPKVWQEDVRDAIDTLEAAARPGGALHRKIAFDHLAMVGQSLGGTVTVLAAAQDPRIKRAVALEPGTVYPGDLLRGALRIRARNGLAMAGQKDPEVRLLIVAAGADRIADPSLFAAPAAVASGAHYEHMIGAGHLGSTDLGLELVPHGPTGSIGGPTAAAQLEHTNNVVLRWFQDDEPLAGNRWRITRFVPRRPPPPTRARR